MPLMLLPVLRVEFSQLPVVDNQKVLGVLLLIGKAPRPAAAGAEVNHQKVFQKSTEMPQAL